MYLSHPVRRIRDEPTPGERIGLVVELAPDADPDALAERVAELDGHLERELGFDAHLVRLPEPAVATLCEFDPIVRVETERTLSL